MKKTAQKLASAKRGHVFFILVEGTNMILLNVVRDGFEFNHFFLSQSFGHFLTHLTAKISCV